MTLQRQRYSRIQRRGQQLLMGAALLLVVGVGSDLQAQMRCNAGGRGGQGSGGQVVGRVPGSGGAISGGGGVNQFAQVMQMMQQLQQLRQMQQQAAMQQMRNRQEMPSRQKQPQTAGSAATSNTVTRPETAEKPTMTRREKLRALIQQRRDEKSRGRPSRRELAMQRSARNRQGTTAASADASSATFAR